MAGKVRRLIDELIQLRSNGRPALEHFLKVNLLLNGIDPERYGVNTADDPQAVTTLEKMIRDYKSIGSHR